MTAATANSPSHRPDYYEILGVPRTADFREIGAAYWRRARGASDEQRTKLNEAYEALNEEDRRRAYDAGLSIQAGEPVGESTPEPAPAPPAADRAAADPPPEATPAPPDPPAAAVDSAAADSAPEVPSSEPDGLAGRLGWPKAM
jgi:curved DNA-binding protein CbpA